MVDRIAAKTRRKDGIPVGTPFSKDYQPDNAGRPKGSLSISNMVKNLLENPEELPKALQDVIKNRCGGNKRAVEAIIMSMMIEALKGDTKAADLVFNRAYGKVADKNEISGPEGEPLEVTVKFGK